MSKLMETTPPINPYKPFNIHTTLKVKTANVSVKFEVESFGQQVYDYVCIND